MNHLNRDAIIGFIVLVIIGLGCVWYVLSHVPPAGAPGVTGTSSPTGAATGPEHITENTDLYTVDAQYPSSTLLATSVSADADAAAVASMKAFEESAVDDFHQSWVGLDDSFMEHIKSENIKGSLAITYKTYQGPNTVSYVYSIYTDTLGAHPNGTYKTFTFDTRTGAELSLADLFAPGTNYAQYLSDYARAQLPAMIAARENVDVSQVDADMLNAGTTADAANFADFYLDGSNLVILFPPYAVGPYVLGTMELDIPLSSVPSLKSDYVAQ
jgi:hypothetical protein